MAMSDFGDTYTPVRRDRSLRRTLAVFSRPWYGFHGRRMAGELQWFAPMTVCPQPNTAGTPKLLNMLNIFVRARPCSAYVRITSTSWQESRNTTGRFVRRYGGRGAFRDPPVVTPNPHNTAHMPPPHSSRSCTASPPRSAYYLYARRNVNDNGPS